MDIVADENHLLLSTEDLEARRLAEKVVDVSTEDIEEDAYRAVVEEVFTWLNRLPTDAVGFAGTLKADRTHTNLITTYSKRCYVPLRLSSSNGVASLQTNKRKNS